MAIEGDKCRVQPLGNRNVDCVRRLERKVQPSQEHFGSRYIPRLKLDPRYADAPLIQGGKGIQGMLPRDRTGTRFSTDDRGEFRGREIANHERFGPLAQDSANSRREGISC